MFSSQFSGNGGLIQEFRRLQEEMDELMGRWAWPLGLRSAARGTFPPMNVGVTPHQVEVYFFAPGLDPQSIDVSVQQNVLTVSGQRDEVQPQGKDEVTWYRKERFNGGFRRVVSLPEDVQPDRIQARYRDGILYVAAERPESARPRKIEIN
jgi:HSP20 family protein